MSAFCGRIGNRVKIPNGAAAVSVEGAHIGFVKPATAFFSWEGASVSLMRKSEDLLGLSSANGAFGIFTERLLHRNGCGDFERIAAALFF